jgi:hypothetical protein
MPSLVPSVWTTGSPAVPYVWCCSECEATFDMGPTRGFQLSQMQIDLANLQFRAHCKRAHPLLLTVNSLGDVPRDTARDPGTQEK